MYCLSVFENVLLNRNRKYTKKRPRYRPMVNYHHERLFDCGRSDLPPSGQCFAEGSSVTRWRHNPLLDYFANSNLEMFGKSKLNVRDLTMRLIYIKP